MIIYIINLFFSVVFEASPRFTPQVTFNRPFIYIILTADTIEPIFIGHYSNVD